MSYICLHCGHRFTNPTNRYNKAINRWEDDAECPNCGSEDFEDAEACSECGTEHLEENLIHGLCEECIKKAARDVRTGVKYGADRTTPVEINGVLAAAYSTEEINAILLNHIMNNGDLGFWARQFATDDKYDFSYWLSERRDK